MTIKIGPICVHVGSTGAEFAASSHSVQSTVVAPSHCMPTREANWRKFTCTRLLVLAPIVALLVLEQHQIVKSSRVVTVDPVRSVSGVDDAHIPVT